MIHPNIFNADRCPCCAEFVRTLWIALGIEVAAFAALFGYVIEATQ